MRDIYSMASKAETAVAGPIEGLTAPRAPVGISDKVIVVGASSDDAEALCEFLASLTEEAPGVVIARPAPTEPTAWLAARLNDLCAITVKEASDGESVIAGQALIAPDGKHLLLRRSGARYYVELRDGPPVSGHRPSADVLFRSAARCAGKNAIGVMMAGMGGDGVNGILELRNIGAYTIEQEASSCFISDLLAEAINIGAMARGKSSGSVVRQFR